MLTSHLGLMVTLTSSGADFRRKDAKKQEDRHQHQCVCVIYFEDTWHWIKLVNISDP